MNTHLYDMIMHQRDVELRRTAEQARLASQASRRRRKMRDPAPVTLPDLHRQRVRPRDVTALEVESPTGSAR